MQKFKVDVFRTVIQHRVYEVSAHSPEEARLQAETWGSCDTFIDEAPFISTIKEESND